MDKLIELLLAATNKTTEKAPDWMEKMKAKGVKDEEMCLTGSVGKFLSAKDPSDLMDTMRHMATKHDILEAARAYAAMTLLVQACFRHVESTDVTYGTSLVKKLEIDHADAEKAVKEAAENLKMVEAKHELLRSLRN